MTNAGYNSPEQQSIRTGSATGCFGNVLDDGPQPLQKMDKRRSPSHKPATKQALQHSRKQKCSFTCGSAIRRDRRTSICVLFNPQHVQSSLSSPLRRLPRPAFPFTRLLISSLQKGAKRTFLRVCPKRSRPVHEGRLRAVSTIRCSPEKRSFTPLSTPCQLLHGTFLCLATNKLKLRAYPGALTF
jgi:hypothetical protein